MVDCGVLAIPFTLLTEDHDAVFPIDGPDGEG